jgi:hypothetical protein
MAPRVDTGAADHLDSQRSGIEPMFVTRTMQPVGRARSAIGRPIPDPVGTPDPADTVRPADTHSDPADGAATRPGTG